MDRCLLIWVVLLDKQLAGKLNVLFGDEEKFNYFLEYLAEREDLLHKVDRSDTDINNRWRTQGKLQFIYELQGLRDTIRAVIKGE